MHGSIGGLEYEVPQSRLNCLVYRRGSLLDGLAMYLSRDTKKFHDNESTHILHNFWTSTHRGDASPSPGGATERNANCLPVYVLTTPAAQSRATICTGQSRHVTRWIHTPIHAASRMRRFTTQRPDLQNILRQSYDYLTITPKLRSTYDGRLIYKTSFEGRKTFLGYNSLAKS